MEDLLRTIEEDAINNKGYISYDTWGNTERSEKYRYLFETFINNKINYFKGEFGFYMVIFRNSTLGKGGMDMGIPSSIYIDTLRTFNKEGNQLI